MRRMMVFGWLLGACVQGAPGGGAKEGEPGRASTHDASAGGPPVTVLFLPGLGPQGPHLEGSGAAMAFPVFEPTPAAAFVQLAAGTADHRLFAERLISDGREVPASAVPPGVPLPVTGPGTQVWAPRMGHVTDQEPGRLHFRPSRGRRARFEAVACPGEIVWNGPAGDPLLPVRVRGCGGTVRLEFPVRVGVPGPAGRIDPAPRVELGENEVGTWIWQEGGQLWAVSVGILRIEAGRVIWHREGPAADAVFGPADWIGLRDGELDIHMQAAFIRGAQRSLFAAIAHHRAPWTVAVVHPLADLRLALAQAPGSWETALLDAAVGEILEFARERRASGHRVALAGVGPVVPVTRVIAKEVFAAMDAFAVVPGEGSVLFLHDRPGSEERRRLEARLVQSGLTPAQGAHLFRVPGGYRLDLPPGTIVGRCPPGQDACAPRDFRGAWAGAPWLTGWVRWPEDEGSPPSGHLCGFLPYLRDVFQNSKNPDSINQ